MDHSVCGKIFTTNLVFWGFNYGYFFFVNFMVSTRSKRKESVDTVAAAAAAAAATAAASTSVYQPFWYQNIILKSSSSPSDSLSLLDVNDIATAAGLQIPFSSSTPASDVFVKNFIAKQSSSLQQEKMDAIVCALLLIRQREAVNHNSISGREQRGPVSVIKAENENRSDVAFEDNQRVGGVNIVARTRRQGIFFRLLDLPIELIDRIAGKK